MNIKQVTLKIDCSSCSSLLFKKPVIMKIADFSLLPFINKAIIKMFPDMPSCKFCDSKFLDRSYTYIHEEKISINEAIEHEKMIERCKTQIASTYDPNSDISFEDRAIIRESLQNQYQKLLNHQTVSA